MVVDASVAAKWVLTESETPAALELLHGEARFAAPALIKVEVAGAVLRQFREGKMELESARLACDDWQGILDDTFVHLLSLDDIYHAALDLAFRARHALADCLYLAAAQHLDAALLTADVTFHERAKKVYDRVTLLPKAA